MHVAASAATACFSAATEGEAGRLHHADDRPPNEAENHDARPPGVRVAVDKRRTSRGVLACSNAVVEQFRDVEQSDEEDERGCKADARR